MIVSSLMAAGMMTLGVGCAFAANDTVSTEKTSAVQKSSTASKPCKGGKCTEKAVKKTQCKGGKCAEKAAKKTQCKGGKCAGKAAKTVNAEEGK